nr:hypothetical protein [Tanacetum cinerariifolium]
AGPIRFVVNEEELVASVINIAIKMYAREGRLPVLGTKFNEFFLYTPIVGSEALSPWEMIGSFGMRNFLLYGLKKQNLNDGLKVGLKDINWDHSFVREFPGDSPTTSLPTGAPSPTTISKKALDHDANKSNGDSLTIK